MTSQAESANESLDRQNQYLTENLASKVARLKNLAVDIENESKDSNTYLSGMDGDFDGATGLLSGSMKRLNTMVSSGKGNRKLMCYSILLLIFIFLIVYFFIGWARG
ncbi:hypothetical protein HELRODRAFT_65318 [Helobdella robusta]|uniref:BET1-like protein n=1 Tax=Helobdella robusta TaxID=6412 RepID=T1FY60_HELRO|nr:hypothetical protein HELRODRAFT_65318 [Helobdella robusta]ESO02449.1 hypothetical protein HELRODRAFT_65318 [Helobdella robusta]